MAEDTQSWQVGDARLTVRIIGLVGWLLKPVIERQRDAASFIGPQRDKSIVPVRELTFQALKPNQSWNTCRIIARPAERSGPRSPDVRHG